MIFTETKLPGAFVIEPEKHEDNRGFFARTYCREEFQSHNLNPCIAQCSISFNIAKGTLRGMHSQKPPHEETKLVRCTMGAIYDVIIDLRAGSPTRRQWVGVELTADNRRMLYIPKGMAHGFITLRDNTEVLYQISESHHPKSACGFRWDDPAFAIDWPLMPSIVSERDQNFPLLDRAGES